MTVWKNRLYYGDNLDILRQHIADRSVDLIYLDPPFNSNRSYNVLFKNKSGDDSSAQIEAFDDTWTWGYESERTYTELVGDSAGAKVADALEAMRRLLGENDVLAYLVMMTARLTELHRVLKPTGSMFLHCDPTASHYLKVLLDAIFGPTCFRNEIVWRRTGAHNNSRRFGSIHDIILFYAKGDSIRDHKWNTVKRPYMNGHVEDFFVQENGQWRTNYYGNVLTGSGVRNGESGKPWRGFDPTAKNRHWAIPRRIVEDCGEDLSDLSQHEKMDRLYDLGYIKIAPGQAWPIYEHIITPGDGTPAPDIWAFQPYTEETVFGTADGIDEDVRWLGTKDRERLGYPTQKPLGLLRRIIKATTDEDDVVLDPFCGCGTAVDAAESLGRRWLGIDITYLAIDLIDKRLRHTFGDAITSRYEIEGIPRDNSGAQALFDANPFDFERWAVSLVRGKPYQHAQVGDRGVDGVVRFLTDAKTSRTIVVSVKGGRQLNPAMVRDLVGTIETFKSAEMGLLITQRAPTRGMKDAASRAGLYAHPSGRMYPKVQIITVEDLLAGKRPEFPPMIEDAYIAAKRRPEEFEQLSLHA